MSNEADKIGKAGVFYARWQVILAVIGLIVTVFGTAQQLGLLQRVLPEQLQIPQFLNFTGAQLELVPVRSASRPGARRDFAVEVTRPPQRGRWRGRLCQGDQIQFIDGFDVGDDIEMARNFIYVDRGEFVSVESAQVLEDGSSPVGQVNAFGVARNCPALD